MKKVAAGWRFGIAASLLLVGAARAAEFDWQEWLGRVREQPGVIAADGFWALDAGAEMSAHEEGPRRWPVNGFFHATITASAARVRAGDIAKLDTMLTPAVCADEESWEPDSAMIRHYSPLMLSIEVRDGVEAEWRGHYDDASQSFVTEEGDERLRPTPDKDTGTFVIYPAAFTGG